MGVIVALVGAALVTGGAFLIFGAWALVMCGAALLTAGLLVDWEKVT